jgi:NADPH:quinone reductase-like Zn-dependent oxidoreductase
MSDNRAAFLVGHKKKPLVVDVTDDRYPDENEIVVKNAAVAINQLDWKMQDTPWVMFNYPLILGVDVAGEVVDVGSDVTRFMIGDRVLGHALSFATQDERHAGFQNYTVLLSNMASPIPPSLSFERAAVLPLGISTASAALFQKSCLALPKPSLNPPRTSTTVLIWGGGEQRR